MLNNISLLIFDLDFTIVDSSHAILKSMNASLKELGLEKRIRYEELKPFIGKEPIDGHFKRFLSDDKHHLVPQLVEKYLQKLIQIGPENSKTMPNAKEVLSHYFGKGYHLSIVSYKSYEASDAILSFLKLRNFFEIIVGRGDAKQKPEPDLVLLVLDRTKVDKDNAVFIGDSVNDIIAGKKAGVKTVGVTTGVCSKIELEKCGADYVTDSLIQLFDIVN